MEKQLRNDALLWGFLLWLTGYALGIAIFPLVPVSMIGWIVMPVGMLVAIWVLSKKIKTKSFRYYIWLAVIWTLMAIILDYVFLVQVFKPADGYYKLDVYLYYLFTLTLPLIVGWKKAWSA